MADVRPFRAVRYARPSRSVVAPPYDVIGPAELVELRARDPHNVVHLTLAEDEEQGGALFRQWLARGVLVEDADAAFWVLAQDFVGPDGVARHREGMVVSLGLAPYGSGVVLPHERTHAGPRASRLRLLRAARAQLEPIFLLYDGVAPLAPPARPADLEAEGTRLWRVEGDASTTAFFADRELMIADGHHRYETALAFHDEDGSPASGATMAVLVSTSDPGLEIFPTHRVYRGRPEIAPDGERKPDLEAALACLAAESTAHAALVAYRAGEPVLVRGAAGELDVELADGFGHEGIAYTADWRDAAARVDAGQADIALLLRATRIEDVFERARAGRVLPQKSTYFFPKLLSGLLFYPLQDGVVAEVA
jgi:uncharacterized protein (DUF1015 family)